jgi:hypothetical protein
MISLGEKMKTKDEILVAVQNGKDSQCIDRRDFSRLCDFFGPEDYGAFGFELADGVDPETITPIELTKEIVLQRLERDLDFAFQKALNQRGISANLMYEVVKMWLWVLDDLELQDWDGYWDYGLPFFQVVAKKYGFHDPTLD